MIAKVVYRQKWSMGAMKIWMLRLSLNVFLLLVYTSKHILFFTSLSSHCLSLNFLRPFCLSSRTRREVRSRYWARNKGSEFGL